MKRNLWLIIFLGMIYCSPALGADAAGPRTSWQETPASAMNAAEKDLQQAGKEFTGAAQQDITPAPVIASPSPAGSEAMKPVEEAAKNTKKPLSTTSRSPIVAGTRSSNATEARDAALIGSPETGYAGTWTDPANGDIITSVIAPTVPPANSQPYPMIIEPVVNGSDWGAGTYGYSGGYNGWNGSWGNNSWPQWPGYPGDSGGYMPTPPPPAPGYAPPVSNRPMPPMFNPGSIPNYPPPPAPGYRPLRPNNPSVWQPGQTPPGTALPPPAAGNQPGWGTNPPPANSQPGWGTPPPVGGQPGWGTTPPAASQPGWGNAAPPVGAQPGWGTPPAMNPGQNPGFHPINPSGAPGFRPLPMQPGGTTWGGSTQSGTRQPLFGRGGM